MHKYVPQPDGSPKAGQVLFRTRRANLWFYKQCGGNWKRFSEPKKETSINSLLHIEGRREASMQLESRKKRTSGQSWHPMACRNKLREKHNVHHLMSCNSLPMLFYAQSVSLTISCMIWFNQFISCRGGAVMIKAERCHTDRCGNLALSGCIR